MKTSPLHTHYLLVLIFCLHQPVLNHAQSFGIGIGIEAVQLNITPSESMSSKEIPLARSVSIYIKKTLKNITFRNSISYQTRSINIIDSLKMSDKVIKFSPYFSKTLQTGKHWEPFFSLGFDFNQALKRKWKNGSNEKSSGGFDELFDANIAIGTGLKHAKSGFFFEPTVSFKVKRPESPSNAQNDFTAKWSRLVFNFSIGYMFGDGNSN